MVWNESGIRLTGLYVCGAITFVMLVLKVSVIDAWSWWRVLLPIGLFVGFNVANLRHLVVNVEGGTLAFWLLAFFSGSVFGGAHIAITVMMMAGKEDGEE